MAIWTDSHPHNKYCQNIFPTFYKTVNFPLNKRDINYKYYFKVWYPHCASRLHNTRSIDAQFYCSNYKWQLHIPATKQPSLGCIYQKYIRILYTCSLHIVTNY